MSFDVRETEARVRMVTDEPVIRVVHITMYSPIKGEEPKVQVLKAPREQRFVLSHVAARIETVRVELETIYPGVDYKVSKVGGLGLTHHIYFNVFPVPDEERPKPRLVTV